jgi:hypothetical protein
VFGVAALVIVAILEQWLEPYSRNTRARAELEQVNEDLRLSLTRRDDLETDLNGTWEPKRKDGAPLGFLRDRELEGYRRAAAAERYDLNLRIASLLQRGFDRVRRLGNAASDDVSRFAGLCKTARGLGPNEACVSDDGTTVPDQRAPGASAAGVFRRWLDSTVSEGTYARTVHHVGSMALILLGYLGLGVALFAGAGKVLHESFRVIADVIGPWITTGKAAVFAGMLGAGALAAGMGATAAFALEDSSFPQDRQRERQGGDGDRRVVGTDLDVGSTSSTVGSSWRYPALVYFDDENARATSEATVAIAAAFRELNARLAALNVSVTSDRDLRRSLDEVSRTLAEKWTTFDHNSEKRVTKLREGLDGIGEVLRRLPEANAGGVSVSNTAWNVTLDSALEGEGGRQLSKIVENTACEVTWEKALQQRNGFVRFWHLFRGYPASPCGSESDNRGKTEGKNEATEREKP